MSGVTTMRATTCPVCRASTSSVLLTRLRSPVIQNAVHPTAEEARAAAVADLRFRSCDACGFVWNEAFRDELIDYAPGYENSQAHSQEFTAHLDARIERIIELLPDRPATVVEIGCGQGDFSARLVARAAGRIARAIGFDPAWRGRDGSGPDGVVIHRRMFVPGDPVLSTLTPDIVIARHTIEHISDPVGFLRSVRSAIGVASRALILLETPCSGWIIRSGAVQDFFYEHCSIFDTGSMARALLASGFISRRIETVFGGQYLWAEAEAAPIREAPDFTRAQAELRAEVMAAASHGRVAVWGAGAKGVTFLALTDPDATAILAAIDVNPKKQGRFITATGHPIVSPAQAADASVATVFVMNPVYAVEIAEIARGLGWSPAFRVLDQFT